MEVAASVIHAIRMKRVNECEHKEWREVPAKENPRPGEMQCCGCTIIATEEARKRLTAKNVK